MVGSAALTFGLVAAVAIAPFASAQEVRPFCLGSDTSACEANRAQLTRDLPRAYAGDYQAQRNVSYCLHNGCDSAMDRNPSLGCAWRLVIIAAGDVKTDATDAGFLKSYCAERLVSSEKAAANAQAGRLFHKIYNRPLPYIEW